MSHCFFFLKKIILNSQMNDRNSYVFFLLTIKWIAFNSFNKTSTKLIQTITKQKQNRSNITEKCFMSVYIKRISIIFDFHTHFRFLCIFFKLIFPDNFFKKKKPFYIQISKFNPSKSIVENSFVYLLLCHKI